MEFRLDGTRIVFDAHPNVHAWFSTRLGGVSEPPYDTLNLSYGVGDVDERVTENRQRILAHEGYTLDDLVMPHQVHHNHIEWVARAWRGRGALRAANPIPQTDGFLTEDQDVVLGMGFADCVPIYLVDLKGRAAGILHAGWRGTAAEIQRLGVEALAERGIHPEDLAAGIGPSIGPCCYEVDQPVYDAIAAVAGTEPLTPQDETHWRLDLKRANHLLLAQTGVPDNQIVEAPYCTGCQPELFYSYRIEGPKTGRMGGYVCLNGN